MYQHNHGMLWCWDVALAAVMGELADRCVTSTLVGDCCAVPVLLGLHNLSALRISEVSAFLGLNYTAVNGNAIRTWAKRPFKRSVCISKVPISEVPLYNCVAQFIGLCVRVSAMRLFEEAKAWFFVVYRVWVSLVISSDQERCSCLRYRTHKSILWDLRNAFAVCVLSVISVLTELRFRKEWVG